jgi:hypothetical protein
MGFANRAPGFKQSGRVRNALGDLGETPGFATVRLMMSRQAMQGSGLFERWARRALRLRGQVPDNYGRPSIRGLKGFGAPLAPSTLPV